MIIVLQDKRRIQALLTSLQGRHSSSTTARLRSGLSAMAWGSTCIVATTVAVVRFSTPDYRLWVLAFVAGIATLVTTASFSRFSSGTWIVSQDAVGRTDAAGHVVRRIGVEEIERVRIIRAGTRPTRISFIAQSGQSVALDVNALPSVRAALETRSLDDDANAA
jgi:hypothetical protein